MINDTDLFSAFVGIDWADLKHDISIASADGSYSECLVIDHTMETIIYAHVQQLIKKLPENKLSLAYRLLLDLADKEAETLSPQADFMRLSLAERRRVMTQQAYQMKAHYEQSANKRTEWQAGDFINES